MEFSEWEPIYRAILADFGFDRAADEHARDVLADLLSDAALPAPMGLLDGLSESTVAVVGAAPSLAAELEGGAAAVDEADAVVAASTAADVCRAAGVSVDVMVTDLDKNNETALAVSREGTPVAAHAHGDNLAAVREWIPRFEAETLVPTTQAAPVGPVVNAGGFTDGDRAAFLADAAGADALRFVGWDFDDPDVDGMKRRKLDWAERLLHWLERRRGERFAVLDGRRTHIEPVEAFTRTRTDE
jgi:hypothetical protein